MPGVVCSVVHRHDVGKTHTIDDEYADQGGTGELDQLAGAGSRQCMIAGNGSLTGLHVHTRTLKSTDWSFESTNPFNRAGLRTCEGRISTCPCLPARHAQWLDMDCIAYRCGGSSGLAPVARTVFPIIPSSDGHPVLLESRVGGYSGQMAGLGRGAFSCASAPRSSGLQAEASRALRHRSRQANDSAGLAPDSETLGPTRLGRPMIGHGTDQRLA